jgi:hypothetical protein
MGRPEEGRPIVRNANGPPKEAADDSFGAGERS